MYLPENSGNVGVLGGGGGAHAPPPHKLVVSGNR